MGARLTGAGWGGCCVALVPVGSVEAFKCGVKRGYYDQIEGMTQEIFDKAVFITKPAPGAQIEML